MTRKFVVNIDAENDFMNEKGALYVGGAHDLIVPMTDYLHSLTAEEVAGILFTYDIHDPEVYAGSPESEMFPLHCERNKWGSESAIARINELKVPTYKLEKGVFNMWEEDSVLIAPHDSYGDASVQHHKRDAFFAALKAGGINDIEIIGVASDFCVTWAVKGFVDRGFNVTVKRDLVKGIVRDFDTVVADDYQGVTNLHVA